MPYKMTLIEALETMIQYARLTSNCWDADMDSKVGKRLMAMSGRLKGYDEHLDSVFETLKRAKELNQ